jgi:hypothetical protein
MPELPERQRLVRKGEVDAPRLSSISEGSPHSIPLVGGNEVEERLTL